MPDSISCQRFPSYSAMTSRWSPPWRTLTSLSAGGMGSREKSVYNALAVRVGFAEGAR